MKISDAKKVLKKIWGYDSFLENQENVINSIISSNDTMAFLPTSGGKSICFQIPGILSGGTTLVISPLISLISDQVKKLNNLGIPSISLAGDYDSKHWDSQLDKIINGDYYFVYISPERALSSKFLERIKHLPLSMLAIDEAHCVSQWGHDFRPSYVKLSKIRKNLINIPCIVLSASVTNAVIEDIKEILSMEDAKIIKGSFFRPNLSVNIFTVNSKESELKKLINPENGKQIIYCRTRSQTSTWVKNLKQSGIKSLPYHAGLSMDLRQKNQEEWANGKINCMVATNAFGMGVDQPNVRQVIHIDIPQSIESLYQEIGRAGRDGKMSHSFLIFENKDIKSFKSRLVKNEISWNALHDAYHKIASVGQIAVGDGQGFRQKIDIQEISQKLGVIKSRFKEILLKLVNEGFFILHDDYKSKSQVILNFSGTELVEKLNNLDIYSDVAYSLARNLPMSNGRWVNFSIKSISNSTKRPLSEVYLSLNKLAENGIIDWTDLDSQIVLEWTYPREPEGHLSVKRSIIDSHIQSKKTKANAILNLISSKNCLFEDILSYFGENAKVNSCSKCSNCSKS
tara:strand:- start:301 stop:2010 length:1710 start_codon:yes stop_codon:yes gene_type:complete